MQVSGEYAVAAAGGDAPGHLPLQVRLIGWWILLALVFRLTGGRTMGRSLSAFAENVEAGG